MSTALYPGSFDPIHNGHVAVIALAAPLFDEIVVGVGHNPDKPSGLFTPDERVELIADAISHLDNVRIELFSGLSIVAAAALGADFLLKGIRGGSDLDIEMQQAHMNLATGQIPTLFVPATGPSALVASTYVRQIGMMGGDISDVVPPAVAERIREKSLA